MYTCICICVCIKKCSWNFPLYLYILQTVLQFFKVLHDMLLALSKMQLELCFAVGGGGCVILSNSIYLRRREKKTITKQSKCVRALLFFCVFLCVRFKQTNPSTKLCAYTPVWLKQPCYRFRNQTILTVPGEVVWDSCNLLEFLSHLQSSLLAVLERTFYCGYL